MNSNHCDMPHFTKDDFLEVLASGHEVGNHTFDHVSALSVSPDKFSQSIRENEEFVAGLAPGYRMKTFAYPYGDMSWATKYRLRRRFMGSRGIFGGENKRSAELSNLRAVSLEDKHRSSFNFKEVIERAAEQKSWVIIFTHDVATSPSPWGCRPDDLDNVLQLALKSDLRIAPVATILEEALATVAART
jgi:peptidoglycan/xylan/chitin deacetylase (PgdA/CDA1 family)